MTAINRRKLLKRKALAEQALREAANNYGDAVLAANVEALERMVSVLNESNSPVSRDELQAVANVLRQQGHTNPVITRGRGINVPVPVADFRTTHAQPNAPRTNAQGRGDVFAHEPLATQRATQETPQRTPETWLTLIGHDPEVDPNPGNEWVREPSEHNAALGLMRWRQVAVPVRNPVAVEQDVIPLVTQDWDVLLGPMERLWDGREDRKMFLSADGTENIRAIGEEREGRMWVRWNTHELDEHRWVEYREQAL